MATALAQIQFIAKRMYSTEQIGEQTRRDHILFEMMPRRQVFGGEDFRYAVRYANPQAVSGTYANARTQAASAGSKGKQFATQPGIKYCIVQLDGRTISRLKASTAAFTNFVTMEFDGGLEETGDSFAFDIYQDGNGRRGRIASIAGNVITLDSAEDARNFKEGMTLVGDNAIDGSSPNAGSCDVTAVDEDNGTITVNTVASANLIVNDYLFRQGDPGTCYDGLADFFPLTAPVLGSDSFRGVDRGSAPRQLAGVRVANSGLLPEEVTGLLAVKAKQSGKKPNCAFWHPVKFHDFTRRLNAKVEFQSAGGSADYGFEYVAIHTTAGIMKVYPDPDCPLNRVYTGKMSSAEIRYLDEGLPDWINDDGLGKTVRMSDADAIEARIRGQAQPVFTVPGEWGVGDV